MRYTPPCKKKVLSTIDDCKVCEKKCERYPVIKAVYDLNEKAKKDNKTKTE